ncbi:pentapeptide repeat-containing protein [Campylobacter jejuni]|uniref:pentapeptide repeat-containing protein n=1 Tax=Campylobacter jejuni TaxID=197 RepID=UPI00363892F7
MEEKIKQAIENIAKNLEVHKEYIRFDNTEQIYIIEDYLNNKIIEIKKNIKFDNLIDYPLKFYYCDFLETVIGRNKTFKEKIIFEEVVFCKVVNFSFSIFDKNINFSNVKFEDKLYFDKCQFKEKFEFFGINNLKAEFNSSHFKKEVYFGKEITDKNVEKSNSFGSCSFEYANFSNCHFKKEVYFKNNDFKQVFFRNSKFNNNIHFNNSIFKDYADFHECEFEKTANFYRVRFDKTPNFSQAIFKGNLNAVNTNLNFTFDDLQERIKQEYAFYETQRTAKEAGVIPNLYQEKSLDKFANDFRDSFRTFKNALIKDNNLLDASNFHKDELYCKEIELKESWNKLKKVDIDEDIDQNNKNYSKLMDFLLLGFYRKLCDHHTDFLKVFNNLILLIALYALFIFGFTWLHDDKLEDTRAILTLFGFFDKFRLYFDIISTIFVVFGCGFFVWKLNSYENKNNISKKQNINFIYIIGDFLNLIKSLFFASFIPCVFYVLFLLFGFFLNLGKDFGYSLLINTLFVSLYICLVYTKSLFFGRYVVLIFSYIGFIIILIKQPNVIHPLIGKIANESDKFFNYPSLIVLNILYTILLALVLFSLQKTARKNSIVPS